MSEVIRRGFYKAAYEDIRWSYEPVSDLWPYIDTASNSSDDVSIDEGRKDQENTDDQEQDEVVSVPRRNPRKLRRGDKKEH